MQRPQLQEQMANSEPLEAQRNRNIKDKPPCTIENNNNEHIEAILVEPTTPKIPPIDNEINFIPVEDDNVHNSIKIHQPTHINGVDVFEDIPCIYTAQ